MDIGLGIKAKRWPPIIAGIAFGLVEILSFIISNSPLGASKPFVEACSIATAILSDKLSWSHADTLLDNYFSVYLPQVSWGSAVLLGVLIGSFISSKLSGDFKFKTVPSVWRDFYGPSKKRRFFWAFIGGIFVALGGRFGQGCISGQLISGFTQLGVGAFIFMNAIWISGVITALLFYRSNILHMTRQEQE